MGPDRPDRDDEADEADGHGRRIALGGFIVILLLAIASVVLIRALGRNAAIEDCLLAHRLNCVPVETPSE